MAYCASVKLHMVSSKIFKFSLSITLAHFACVRSAYLKCAMFVGADERVDSNSQQSSSFLMLEKGRQCDNLMVA